MFTISQLGTFDVENYGDLLYPLVFRHILKGLDSRVDVCHYSLLEGDAPQEAGFKTHAAHRLFEAEPKVPQRLVVGGGDILRTDWKTIAASYEKTHTSLFSRPRSFLGSVGPLRQLRRKYFPAPGITNSSANRFRQRRMSYPAVGPFLIDPADLPAGSAVSYMSCGVPHDFPPTERDKVKRTFENARFIYLRDEQSREKLRRCGVDRELYVAPDLIVTLSEQFDRATEAQKGRQILAKLGVKLDRPILCFQSKRFTGFLEEEIAEYLKSFRQRTESELILLPLGYCHGDAEFLRCLEKKSEGTLRYVNVYSVFDMISIIAASDFFVGTSLHGNITAFSFGIPHLLGPLPVDKSEGFLTAVGLPAELKLNSWSEMNDKIDMAMGLGRPLFSDLARKARLKVHDVVRELLENC